MSKGPSASTLRGVVIIAGAVLAGCSDRPTEQPADLVLRGGTVYTAGPGAGRASAVAVRDGRIAYVGDDAGADPLAGPDTRVVGVGKAADLIVLDRNLLDLDPSAIGRVGVLLTLVDGSVVWESDEFELPARSADVR
jgi:predicted amidohydrolase YtcJ